MKLKYTDEFLINIIKKYDNYTDFILNEKSAYVTILRTNRKYLLENIKKTFKKNNKYSYEYAKNISSRYSELKNFRICEIKLYKYICYNKYFELLSHMERKKIVNENKNNEFKNWNKMEMIEYIDKYDTLKKFRDENLVFYQYILKNMSDDDIYTLFYKLKRYA
jgi:hypothetical protein